MDKIAVYTGTRNIYDQMYVCLKSLILTTPMDRVFLLIEDDEFPYPVPENVSIANVSTQEMFRPGSPNYNSPWSYMAMLKCCLANMFSDMHGNILWLDCDTIVLDDISDLFSVDLSGFYYAGVMEPAKSKDIFRYINTGVLLCNLDMLRDSGKEIEIIDFMNTYRLNFPDQDAINLLCQGKLRLIDSMYNSCGWATPTIRGKIRHFAAEQGMKDSWEYRRFEDIDLPTEEHKDE